MRVPYLYFHTGNLSDFKCFVLLSQVSYLRAGTTLWVPPEVRGDIDAVIAGKATAEKADVATEDVDAGWMWTLMAHARGLRFGERFDLELCRGVVAAAFAEESGGLGMRGGAVGWGGGGHVSISLVVRGLRRVRVGFVGGLRRVRVRVGRSQRPGSLAKIPSLAKLSVHSDHWHE